MMHWIFIALFVASFWNLLRLIKELEEIKNKVKDLDTRCNNLSSDIEFIYKAAAERQKLLNKL